jgi:hypothetical protein
MHALTLYLIMRLGFISTVLCWGALLYFGYLFCQYCRVWWDSPCDGDNGWGEFWRGKRKRATVAAVAMIIAMALPSTKEATVMMVVPAVAQSSIWDRLLGGLDADTVEQARRWARDTAER